MAAGLTGAGESLCPGKGSHGDQELFNACDALGRTFFGGLL